MLHAVEGGQSSISPSGSSPISCKGGGKRKPLQILTGIFSRKNHREMPESAEEKDNFYLADDTDVDMWDTLSGDIPEPREALHSPYHAKTIDQDMQNLRLSRQDNPFLQVLASRECLSLNESDDGSEYEEKNLMSKENVNDRSRGDPLSLEEVHARLVRSPPPVMWTRASEPSFSHLTASHTSSLGTDFVFQFPPPETGPTLGRLVGLIEPSPTHSCRSHASCLPQGHSRFLGPFKKENTLEILTAKFNLSPQPRRRPPNLKTRPFPNFSTSS